LCLDVSADGRLLAVGSSDCTVTLFDVENSHLLSRTDPLPNDIDRIEFSSQEPSIKVIGLTPPVRKGAFLAQYQLEWPNTDAMRQGFDAGGKVVADRSPELPVIDFDFSSSDSQGPLATTPPRDGDAVLTEVRSVAVERMAGWGSTSGLTVPLLVLPDAKHAIIQGRDRQLHLMELETTQPVRRLEGSDNVLQIWSDGSAAIGILEGGVGFPSRGGEEYDEMMYGAEMMPGVMYPGRYHVARWDLNTGQISGYIRLSELKEALSACAIASDGRWAALGTRSGKLYGLRLTRFEPLRPAAPKRKERPGAPPPKAPPSPLLEFNELDEEEITSLAILPDNVTILSSGPDGLIRVWNAQNRRSDRSFSVRHPAPTMAAGTGSAQGFYEEMDAPGTYSEEMYGSSRGMRATAGSDISQILVSAEGDPRALSLIPGASMCLWNTADGSLLATLACPVWRAALSPDGLLAVTAAGGDLVVWDLERQRVSARSWLDGNVHSIAFLPPARQFITMTDKTLTFWEIRANTP
jgi:WD40 repeat protein